MKQHVRTMATSMVVAATLAFVGCEGDSGDDAGTSSVPQGNSRFYGVYIGTISGGGGGGQGTVTVGSDVSRGGEDMTPNSYMYIPASGTTETYSKVQADGDQVTVTVTISGQTVTEHSERKWHGGGWGDVAITFAADYNSGTLTGGGVDQEGHPWTMSGTFVRQQ